MRIGVLETGPVITELELRYGSYADFFERFLRPHAPDFAFTGYRTYQGEIPANPSAQDGWIISGSKHGVYEDHDWLPPLEAFIRKTVSQKVPMAGICFGHQIMAQALGARVEKYARGWGLGHQTYQLSNMPEYFDLPTAEFAGFAVHQDQVLTAPKGAAILASNEFCAIAGLAYGDRESPHAISLQPHPEFEPDFMADLIAARRGSTFSEAQSDAASGTLDTPTDNAQWGRWIASFFTNMRSGV